MNGWKWSFEPLSDDFDDSLELKFRWLLDLIANDEYRKASNLLPYDGWSHSRIRVLQDGITFSSGVQQRITILFDTRVLYCIRTDDTKWKMVQFQSRITRIKISEDYIKTFLFFELVEAWTVNNSRPNLNLLPFHSKHQSTLEN